MPCFSVIKKIETDAAHISLCSDNIIRVMIKKNTEVTPAHLKAMFEIYKELTQSHKYSFLYYTEDGSTSVSEEGRAYSKKEEHSFEKACVAVVVTRLAQKLIANFYFKINKPSYPFRVFNKMDEAEKWCLKEYAKNLTAELV